MKSKGGRVAPRKKVKGMVEEQEREVERVLARNERVQVRPNIDSQIRM